MNKRTKIIATIGPASRPEKILTELAKNGMNVCRINMSHGSHDEHKETFINKKAVEEKTGMWIATLVDLCGPKIRIGDFATGSIELKKGQDFILTTTDCIGDNTRVFVNYPTLEDEVIKGQEILLYDGKIRLVVTTVKGSDVHAKVLIGGELKSKRGINIPNANLSIKALTAKDKKDALWGIEQGADYFALSFVRKPSDITDLKKLLIKHSSQAGIIAKIETPEAVACIDEIIALSDGIMVARGDLAVEIGPEKVPYVQKMIIKKCNEVGKPVITATQMLDSMIHNQVPTRAEVSDVANAIIDGTDAVMLSEETALGEFPIETVKMMADVAREAEEHITTHRRYKVHNNSIVDSVSSSVVHNAEDVGAKAIVVLTETGFTARVISRYRPTQPVIALSPYDFRCRQIVLSAGCEPYIMKPVQYVAQATDQIKALLVKEKIAKKGDRVIISAGVPIGVVGSTNMMMVITI